MSGLQGYLHVHTDLEIGLPLGPYGRQARMGKSSRQQWDPRDLLQPIAAFAKTAIVDPRTGSAKIPDLRHLSSFATFGQTQCLNDREESGQGR
jgi:hypothetical protein